MASLTYRLTLLGEFKADDTGSVGYTSSIIHDPYDLASGSTDTAIPFGGVTTASVVYLRSDQDVTLNLNSSSGTDIAIKADKPFFSCGLSVTALYLSNSSGSTASVTAFIGGA